jgi:hypothetical protein
MLFLAATPGFSVHQLYGCMQEVAVPGQQQVQAVQLASSPRSASSSNGNHVLQAGICAAVLPASSSSRRSCRVLLSSWYAHTRDATPSWWQKSGHDT